MALMACRECGGKCSDQASQCPHCGLPLRGGAATEDPSGVPRAFASTRTSTSYEKPRASPIVPIEPHAGSTGLTPATPCCQSPEQRCPAQPELWTANPIWTILDFQIDEPARAQYSYESDGATLTIRGVEDPECNGNVVTVEALGRIVNGELEIAQSERR